MELVSRQFDILADLFANGHLEGQTNRIGDNMFFVTTKQSDGSLKIIDKANWSQLAELGQIKSLTVEQAPIGDAAPTPTPAPPATTETTSANPK